MADLKAIRHPISSLPIEAKIDIAGFPDWVGIDEAHPSVWISNRDHDSVVKVDPGTNKASAEIARSFE